MSTVHRRNKHNFEKNDRRELAFEVGDYVYIDRLNKPQLRQILWMKWQVADTVRCNDEHLEHTERSALNLIQ